MKTRQKWGEILNWGKKEKKIVSSVWPKEKFHGKEAENFPREWPLRFFF